MVVISRFYLHLICRFLFLGIIGSFFADDPPWNRIHKVPTVFKSLTRPIHSRGHMLHPILSSDMKVSDVDFMDACNSNHKFLIFNMDLPLCFVVRIQNEFQMFRSLFHSLVPSFFPPSYEICHI